MKIIYPEGATPLDQDGLNALIPGHIVNQGQLNEWEHANILACEKWVYSQRTSHILSISFLKQLHKKMFNETWTWAGAFRKTQTNIGVEWHQIGAQLKLLCDDFKYHLTHKTYSLDEIAVRFHHRLVLIHPFVNGNGRHARLIADIIAVAHGQKRFTWGLTSRHTNLTDPGTLRQKYLKALRLADQGDLEELIAFSRS